MKKNDGIRSNMFRNLILVSFIPYILAIIIFAIIMTRNSVEDSRNDGMFRNQIMNEKLEDVLDLHLTIMRNFAVNPGTRQFILQEEEDRDPVIQLMLEITNGGFKDSSNMSITRADGMQIARTDDHEMLNVSDRQYFIKTLEENTEVISDVLIGRVSNKPGIFLTVPVVEMDTQNISDYRDTIDKMNAPLLQDDDTEKYIIGIVQREYGLDFFQDFVEAISEDEIRVVILDNQGKLIADSGVDSIGSEEERADINSIREQVLSNIDAWNTEEVRNFGDKETYSFEAGTDIKGAENEEGFGSMNMEIDGEASLVCFSVNTMTGWLVATIRPYRDIREQVIHQALLIGIIGSVVLALIAVVAFYISKKSTKDISDEVNALTSARDRFKSESETDKLTDLYNKGALERMAKARLNSGERDGLDALYVIDLDHFKEVNDTLGHQAGDEILKEFAKRLKKVFRTEDIVARFGGDEFVVVLTDMPNEEVIQRKAAQINEVALNIQYEEKNAGISASIGIATAKGQEMTYEELFSKADKSVYIVKGSGRNGYSYNEGQFIRQ